MIYKISYLLLLSTVYIHNTYAHGFNANTVKTIQLPSGIYRVVIQYTHISIGEYREAHADFKNLKDASKFAQVLINGADFFLGNIKESVHFHKDGNKPSPF